MKLKTCIFFAAAVLFLSPVALAADQMAVPVAIPLDPVFEFKAVPEGSVVQHDFKIKNTGTATLKIQKVRTG